MKILQICPKPPFPAKDGGSLAMHSISTGLLKEGHTVKILCLSTQKASLETEKLPKEYLASTKIETIYLNTSINIFSAVVNLFSDKSYNIQRFISKEFDEKITKILMANTFDVVQLESLYTTPYINTIRKLSKAKIILRSHNIEHIIWERISDTTKGFFRRKYLNLLSKRLKKYENDILRKVDGIITISSTDLDFYSNHNIQTPSTAIPFGIDIAKYEQNREKIDTNTLFHLGSMDWIPNENGIRWFLENVWNAIHLQHPQLQLHLAGRNMPEWLINSSIPNVHIDGEIENAIDYINSKAVMIVPLLSGSGIRIKIIEGMALGKAIISTSIGAEGINYKNKKNILIANNPTEFAEQISDCYVNKKRIEDIGNNATNLIKSEYNSQLLTKKLILFYKEIIK